MSSTSRSAELYIATSLLFTPFPRKLGHSFVDIKARRGPCIRHRDNVDSCGRREAGSYVWLTAIGACSVCERPLPLLGNIIQRGRPMARRSAHTLAGESSSRRGCIRITFGHALNPKQLAVFLNSSVWVLGKHCVILSTSPA